MAKGMLMDEHGFQPETCKWIIGGLDWPMKPLDFVAKPHPANIAVSDIAQGKELGAMLDAGELDALLSADILKCILERSPNVERLYPDYSTAEAAYYRSTGIFPVMHAVVIRKDVLAQNPGLARTVYNSFCKAKQEAVKGDEHSAIFNSMGLMFPWFNELMDRDRASLGQDWWPYGIAANRNALEAILRYHHEQGITPRRFTLEEIFAPDLLDT